MDNTELLKMVGTTLETLAGKINAALAPPQTGTLRERHPDACLAPCDQYAPCMSRVQGVRALGKTWSGFCGQPRVCVAYVKLASHAKAEELLQGYTLTQWGAIREGGYLCQFSNDGESWTKGARRLGSVDPESTQCNFAEGRDTTLWWSHCRPAQIPGVLRPWFGGDCPVSASTRVMVKWGDGDIEVGLGDSFIWDIDDTANIIAYMEV